MKIKMSDYATYELNRDADGGSYAYHETAELDAEFNIVSGEHSSSAEIGNYCPDCGRFGGPRGCDCADGYQPSKTMEQIVQYIKDDLPQPVIYPILHDNNLTFSVDVPLSALRRAVNDVIEHAFTAVSWSDWKGAVEDAEYAGKVARAIHVDGNIMAYTLIMSTAHDVVLRRSQKVIGY
jgi:hypothetical protein